MLPSHVVFHDTLVFEGQVAILALSLSHVTMLVPDVSSDACIVIELKTVLTLNFVYKTSFRLKNNMNK